MKYHFKVHKEGKGFWAECLELKGCITEGDSIEELNTNMQDALNLYVSEPEDSKDFAAFPDESIKKAKNIVEVPLEPLIASSFLARYQRMREKSSR
jgi:predicted RNase H-like HicB family nuclease